MTKVKEPILVDKVFNDNDFLQIKSLFNDPKSFGFQEGFSRWVASDGDLPLLKQQGRQVVEA